MKDCSIELNQALTSTDSILHLSHLYVSILIFTVKVSRLIRVKGHLDQNTIKKQILYKWLYVAFLSWKHDYA